VRYFSEAPWPVGASGNGLGLIRLDAGAYGNDIINWGDGLIGGTPGVGNVAFETSPPSSPGVPTVSVQPDGDISLSFGAANDPQSGIMRYRVFRAAPPGTPSAVEIGNSATTSFTDESVALNQAYSYTVRAESYSGILGSASTSPQQIRVFGMTGFTKVDATHFRVTFSETVSTASAQNLANYVLSNATLVSAVREAAGTSVLLETAQPIVEGTGYRVMANNLVGTAAGINSVILPNSTRSVIPGVANGLLGEYFDEPTLTVFATPPASAEVGPKVGERTDPVINFVWLQQPNPYTGGTPPFVPNATLPISARDTIGVRWTGRLITPAVTGSYTFSFTISSNDGVRFWIDTDDDGVFEDSERVVNAWPAASSPQTGAVNLVGNQVYDIRIDFFESNSTAQIVMNWQYPGQSLINVPSANMLTPVTTESDRPNVTAIKLGSTDWTAAFKSQLQAAGFGTGGVNLPVGGTSARLPWSNLNQVSMTFDEDVNVTPESLLVNGVNAASYGVLDVEYDLATYTATWILASPLPADRVTLSLSSAAADLVGNTVEGATGGTVLALPGDVNQSGAVDAADFRASLDAQFRGIGSPGYSVLLDTDGNGAINIQDWQNVQVAIGDTIPSPSPAAAPGAVVASGNTSRVASDRSSGGGALRVSPASRLSRLAVDQVVATPSESSARTLRASRAPRTTAVNPAVIDQLFTTN
jgi:hypothetical protein